MRQFLHNSFHAIRHTIALSAAVLLITLPVAHSANAVGAPCMQNSDCPAKEHCLFNICEAPEMSDYLAMGFVLAATGIVIYVRRKAAIA